VPGANAASLFVIKLVRYRTTLDEYTAIVGDVRPTISPRRRKSIRYENAVLLNGFDKFSIGPTLITLHRIFDSNRTVNSTNSKHSECSMKSNEIAYHQARRSAETHPGLDWKYTPVQRVCIWLPVEAPAYFSPTSRIPPSAAAFDAHAVAWVSPVALAVFGLASAGHGPTLRRAAGVNATSDQQTRTDNQ
jgi:hypothetical protein